MAPPVGSVQGDPTTMKAIAEGMKKRGWSTQKIAQTLTIGINDVRGLLGEPIPAPKSKPTSQAAPQQPPPPVEPVKKQPFKWTPERMKKLNDMNSAYATPKQIADAIGTSEAAVKSKIRRTKPALNEKTQPTPKPPAPKPMRRKDGTLFGAVYQETKDTIKYNLQAIGSRNILTRALLRRFLPKTTRRGKYGEYGEHEGSGGGFDPRAIVEALDKHTGAINQAVGRLSRTVQRTAGTASRKIDVASERASSALFSAASMAKNIRGGSITAPPEASAPSAMSPAMSGAAMGAAGLGGGLLGGYLASNFKPQKSKSFGEYEADNMKTQDKDAQIPLITFKADKMTFEADKFTFKGFAGSGFGGSQTPPLPGKSSGGTTPSPNARVNQSFGDLGVNTSDQPTPGSQALTGPPGLMGKVGGWLGLTPQTMGDGTTSPGLLGSLMGPTKSDGGAPPSGGSTPSWNDDKKAWTGGATSSATGSTPGSTSMSSDGTGMGSVLASQRKPYMDYLDAHPDVKSKMMGVALAENDKAPQEVMETMINRAVVHKVVPEHFDSKILTGAYYASMNDGGYDRANRSLQDSKTQARLNDAYGGAMSGSNRTNLSTDNSSAGVAAHARETQTVGLERGGETFSRKDKSDYSSLHGIGVTRNTQDWVRNTTAAAQQQAQQAQQQQAQAWSQNSGTSPWPGKLNQTGDTPWWMPVTSADASEAPAASPVPYMNADGSQLNADSSVASPPPPSPSVSTDAPQGTPVVAQSSPKEEEDLVCPATSKEDHFNEGFSGLNIHSIYDTSGLGQ